MPQRNLRHSHYIYSNHSDNKLITLFCNQFATTPPKNPVFSGISSVFLLFPLVDLSLFCTIYGDWYWHLYTIFSTIICIIFFYEVDCGQEAVDGLFFHHIVMNL